MPVVYLACVGTRMRACEVLRNLRRFDDLERAEGTSRLVASRRGNRFVHSSGRDFVGAHGPFLLSRGKHRYPTVRGEK